MTHPPRSLFLTLKPVLWRWRGLKPDRITPFASWSALVDGKSNHVFVSIVLLCSPLFHHSSIHCAMGARMVQCNGGLPLTIWDPRSSKARALEPLSSFYYENNMWWNIVPIRVQLFRSKLQEEKERMMWTIDEGGLLFLWASGRWW